MQHLDEARIVEYLDMRSRETDRTTGDLTDVAEHLETCIACGAVADRLRAERDQAASILSRSGPDDIIAPPFDEIVRGGEHARRPGGRTFRILALAATAVIVGGVGWLGRDLVIRRQESTPVAVHQEAPAARTDAQREPAGVFRDSGGRVAAAEPAPTPAPVATSEPAAPVEADAFRQVEQQAKADDDRTPRNEAPAAAPPARVADAIAQDRAAPDSPRAVLAERAAVEPAPAEEPSAVASAVGRGVADETEERARRLAVRWQPVTREEAERALGGPVQVVAGLVVLEHARDRTDSGRVRTLQVIGPEVSLELVQARAARRDAMAGPAGAGDSDVVAVTRNGFLILARAPIGRDSLAALLRRLGPQAP